jgi:acetoin utilization deacetylase AcuC-like enzyme
MLLRVHTPEYIRAIETGEPRALAEGQKFPWSPQLFPSVCLTNGAVAAAARHALRRGVACALASGFHHSNADHGEGFCTFNGLIVALEELRAARGDPQCGDPRHGPALWQRTATLVPSRPWVTAASIYGNDYWQGICYRDVVPVRHGTARTTSACRCHGLGAGAALRSDGPTLPRLLSRGRPDLLLYQAGADPTRRTVLAARPRSRRPARARPPRFPVLQGQRNPLAWVLAGGYTPDTSKVVQVHVNTFEACKEVHES